MSANYVVEYLYSYGWDNAGWQEDNVPVIFKTAEEAQEGIAEVLEASAYAYKKGYLDTPASSHEYRIKKYE